ncbi:hypothetical protein SteCoe_18409 [Stentor coeruleus]|uniref:Uncharacterized protein n=1 Tax=Stentor coeruleus TaxID=5963 RepID=A0A1R2BWI9_9CILI|nr:hypothetical protein SteCoe_18409 [Stentor coeruleus]
MWNSSPACKDTAERDAITEHAIHRQKLNTIKSRIDNKPPKVMPHLKRKAKKELEEHKSQAIIQHQNQLLLKKLEKIENNAQKTFSFTKNSSGYLNKLRVDNLQHINNENGRMLDRIQSAKPYYSARKQKRDYIFNKYLSSQLSENAKRIPRVSSYNQTDLSEMIKSAKYSRPNITSEVCKFSNKSTRPVSAKQIKENL